MPHKDSVAVFRTWYAPIIELARFLAGVRARPGIRRTESRRLTIRSHGNGSRLPRRCVVFIAKPTRRELAPLEAVAFLEVAVEGVPKQKSGSAHKNVVLTLVE